MNSILRQSHIRSSDLRNFLHNYDSSNASAVSNWAKTACVGLEPGSLVFIVEPVTLPFGLISFSRKEEDNFRVTDFAVVARIEDGKAMVVSITSNTYELRFLEALLEERAKKSIIEGKRFSFVAAKPTSTLSLTKFQELERLSSLYAKSGSRRGFMNANAQEEPAIALLSACGVHWHSTNANKQPIDIGSICHSLFNTDMKLWDNNCSQFRDIFVPLPSDFSPNKTIPIPPADFEIQGRHIDLLSENSPQFKSENSQENIGFNLLQSWGGLGDSLDTKNNISNENISSSVITEENELDIKEEESSPQSLANIDLVKEEESSPQSLVNIDLVKEQESSPAQNESIHNIEDNAPTNSNKSQVIPETIQPDDVYKHLSEAIKDLLVVQPQTPTNVETAESPDPAPLLPESISISSSESENLNIETENPAAIFASADVVPSTLDDFQEPKGVMNEMASLASKLELQVARAAKKLAAKVSEVEQRLTTDQNDLLNLIIQEDKDSYAELVVRIDLISKQFESLFDTLKAELAEKAANSREQLKVKLSAYQEKIDKTEGEQRENLIEEFKQNKAQFDRLIEKQENELNKLINIQIEVLNKRIQVIDQILEDTAVSLDMQLENHLSGFKERMEEKALTLVRTLDYQIDNLNKCIERLYSEGSEQLGLAKNEFLGRLEHIMQIIEIDLSRQVRKAQTESFLPRLKERKQIIEAMMHEMMQIFTGHPFSQAKAQLEKTEHNLVLARQQLKKLVEECLGKLDIVGRNQQSGLEEIFKVTADLLEQKTTTVLQFFKQAEQEINECETAYTKLAQSYNLDGDPKLISLRQDVYSKADSLKAQLKNNLETALDDNCLKLADVTQSYHVKLNTKRAELVQQVRLTSDKSLLSVKQAIHDAFLTIQSQREKYME